MGNLNHSTNVRQEVALAMALGGAFEDCMTPSQAVELVKERNVDHVIYVPRRPGYRVGGSRRKVA